MKKFLLFVLLAAPLCLFAQHARYTLHFLDQSNPNAALRIPFMQFLPVGHSTTSVTKYPLIIFLHGQGEAGYGETQRPSWDPTQPSDIERLNSVGLPLYLNDPATTMTFTNSSGNPESFVVLVPQKHKEQDANGFEKQFPAYYVDSMINYALRNLNVDPNRIFLTGLSLGAGIVWDYPAASDANARKIAGIVPVSGNPVYSYVTTSSTGTPLNGGAALLCNIPENGVRSRAYVGANDAQFRRDSARRATVHINDTCHAQAPYISTLDTSVAGGHNAAYWNTIYNPNFSGSSAVGDLNMYRWMINIVRAPNAGLPVNLLYFKGKNLNEQNILTWSTTREVNFDRFEILRSSDGKTFTSVATIRSQVGNQATKDYTFRDNAPKGISHYQLKQIDKDNTFKLSNVITINNSNRAFIIEKYPNPVTSELNVAIEGNLFGNIELQILDVRGNLVKKMIVRKDQAAWKGTIDVRALTNGMYMLQMKSSDGRKEVSNFIKK